MSSPSPIAIAVPAIRRSRQARVVWVVRRKATEAIKPAYYDMGFEFTNIKEADRQRVDTVVAHFLKAQNKSK